MNHYPKHIGDWRVATGKLTRVQRDIYSELIDTYYDKEQPLTADFARLAEDQACRTEEELAALRYVLDRFFRLMRGSDGALSYVHERCDEELAAFNRKSQMARINGKKGGLTPRATRRIKQAGSERFDSANRSPSEGLATPDPRVKKDSPDGESKESSVASAPHPPSPPDGEDGGTAEPAKAPTPSPPPPPSPGAQNALAGLEPASPARPAKKAPKDFKVNAPMAAWACDKCPLLSMDDVQRETEMFRNHTFSRAITDWQGAWRNWLLREQKQREQRAPRGGRIEQQARRDDFMDKLLKGDGDGQRGFEGALDVESRVVRDGEGDAADEGAG